MCVCVCSHPRGSVFSKYHHRDQGYSGSELMLLSHTLIETQEAPLHKQITHTPTHTNIHTNQYTHHQTLVSHLGSLKDIKRLPFLIK